MDLERLKEVRKDRDLFQEDVAKYLNVTQTQYSRWERGANLVPIDVLNKLADFYNTSVDYLIGRTDEMKPYKKSYKKMN